MSNRPQIIQVFDSWGEFGACSFAAQIACSLSKKGRVLLVDMNEKANATSSLGKNPLDFASRNFNLFLKKRYRSLNYDDNLKSLQIKVDHDLYLVPGFPHLPDQYTSKQVKTALYNLLHSKDYYDYIIIDSPSLFNYLNKKLFKIVTATLIPFSSSHISHGHIHKILDYKYLKNLKDSSLLFISKSSSLVSREVYLGLCKKFQQILMDIPIKRRPYFSVLKNQIDENIHHYHERKTTVMSLNENISTRKIMNAITEEVLDKIQTRSYKIPKHYGFHFKHYISTIYKTVALVSLFFLIQFIGTSFSTIAEPQVTTLSFFERENRPQLEHYFGERQSLYKVIKWVISHHMAIVPTAGQINTYIQEIVFLHNQSHPYSKRIISNIVPKNTTVKFPPPSNIFNQEYHKVYPAYSYFLKTVDYEKAYITGEWAERGLGGHQKHQGLDIAAPLGTIIKSPIDGVAYLSYSVYGGKVICIREGKNILYFAHLGKRLVKTGQFVHKGDPIGTIGLTGRTSGPHVNIGFGIEFPDGIRIAGKNYKFTDPLFFFYRKNFLSSVLNS